MIGGVLRPVFFFSSASSRRFPYMASSEPQQLVLRREVSIQCTYKRYHHYLFICLPVVVFKSWLKRSGCKGPI